MKHCIDCGAELATPLEEFGELGKEKCQSCFLEQQWVSADLAELKTLENDLIEFDKAMDEKMEERDEIDSEIRRIENDRDKKATRARELKLKINGAVHA